MGEIKINKTLQLEDLKERDYLGDIDVDGRIIFK
jgi:hypothetical protein